MVCVRSFVLLCQYFYTPSWPLPIRWIRISRKGLVWPYKNWVSIFSTRLLHRPASPRIPKKKEREVVHHHAVIDDITAWLMTSPRDWMMTSPRDWVSTEGVGSVASVEQGKWRWKMAPCSPSREWCIWRIGCVGQPALQTSRQCTVAPLLQQHDTRLLCSHNERGAQESWSLPPTQSEPFWWSRSKFWAQTECLRTKMQ